MKIVISTYTYLPDIGGVAKNKSTLINALLERGYDVKVVTNSSGEMSDSKLKYEIIRNPNPLKLINVYFWADIILFSNLSFKLAWPVIFSGLFKAKMGLHHHASSAFKRPKTNNFIRTWIEDRIINNSVHYVNSKYTIKDGHDFFKNLSVEVTYPISSRAKITDNTIENFSKKKDAVFVGRMAIEKGPLFLVENFLDIKKHLGIEKIYFAGDGDMLESLRKSAPPGIVFLGALSLDDVYKTMDECEYVFVPSIWNEPFGNVAVEGIAAGAVVISSNNGGLPEACGNIGKLFDFSIEGSFINALIEAKKTRVELLQSDIARKIYFESIDIHLSQFQENHIIDVIESSI